MRTLVFAAHPDDEVLGCGGTLYKLSKKKKNRIFLAFAADGVMGRFKEKTIQTEKEIKERFFAARKVARILKADIVNENEHPKYSDQSLDQEKISDVISWISEIVNKIKPDIVFTHYYGDLNSDHRIIAEATLVAARSKVNFIKEIYCYEIPETTEQGSLAFGNFQPNIYEKIDPKIKTKLFRQYQTEHGKTSAWEKGFRILGEYRGFNSGYDFAEAFMLVRKRND